MEVRKVSEWQVRETSGKALAVATGISPTPDPSMPQIAKINGGLTPQVTQARKHQATQPPGRSAYPAGRVVG